MAWTAPMTAVANTVFTAAQFNTHVRDNLLETAPGKATTVSGYFVATGTNAIAQRIANKVTNNSVGTTTNTSYNSTLGGTPGTNPAVTITTGERALVLLSADMAGSGTAGFVTMGYDVSGATTLGASEDRSVYMETYTGNANKRLRVSEGHIVTGLTAGSNVFTLTYKYGSGGGSTATFQRRSITVVPF